MQVALKVEHTGTLDRFHRRTDNTGMLPVRIRRRAFWRMTPIALTKIVPFDRKAGVIRCQ